jgi:hypothetical protein
MSMASFHQIHVEPDATIVDFLIDVVLVPDSSGTG